MPTIALRLTLLLAVAAFGPACATSFDVGVAPELAARDAARTCTSLRSGTYRVVSPTLGGLPADQSSRFSLDAVRLTITRDDGSSGIWQAQGDCRFIEARDKDTMVDYVVSGAGVLAARVTAGGGTVRRVLLAFPEQVHEVSALAGSWNLLGLKPGDDGFFADGGSMTISRTGEVTAATECANPATWSVATCSPLATGALGQYRPDPAGGFVYRTASQSSRAFLFKAASGPPMLVGIGGDGGFFIAARAAPAEPRFVNEKYAVWCLDVTGRLASATSTYINEVTVLEVDAVRQKRLKRTAGLSDEHPETLWIDSPRPGYVTRPKGEAPGPNSLPVRFNETTALGVPGTGVWVLVIPGVKLYEISIRVP